MQRRKERYIPNDFEISDDHRITPYTPADKIVEIIVEGMLDVVRQQLNITDMKPKKPKSIRKNWPRIADSKTTLLTEESTKGRMVTEEELRARRGDSKLIVP